MSSIFKTLKRGIKSVAHMSTFGMVGHNPKKKDPHPWQQAQNAAEGYRKDKSEKAKKASQKGSAIKKAVKKSSAGSLGNRGSGL